MGIQFRPLLPIVGRIVVFAAGYGGLLVQVFAAPPDPSARGESSTESVTAGVLRLSSDRQIEQWLQASRNRIDAGDFSSAANLLMRVMNADVEALVAFGDSAIPARTAALQLTARLPDDVRLRLEGDLDRTSRDLWTSVKFAATPEQIAEFATRHRATLAGLDALRRLAAAYRDASRHELAAVAWLRIADHPRTTQDQRTAAWLARIDSLASADRLQEAERVCVDTLRLELADRIVLAGQEISPREWILARKQELAGEILAQTSAGMKSVLAPRLPALQPTWSRELHATAELEKNIGDVQKYFREQGVVSSSALRPVVTGNQVIARTMEGIAAFDVATGEPLWSQPNHEYAWMSDRPAYLEKNLIYRAAMAGAWHRRTEADSVFGSMSTDGRMVVVVQDPDQSRFEFPLAGGPQRPGPQNGTVSGVRWNRLCGYDISSKELRWQIGGPPTGPADVFGGMSFFGTPLFMDDVLFGVGRRDDELRLLAIDRDTGHLRWSVALGVLPPQLADATARRRMACPVTLVDGLLLCPTASGALVAVDPVTRAVAWMFRCAVVQHDLPARPVNGVPHPGTPDVWWNEWREVTCVSATTSDAVARTDTRLVLLASPDADELHAVKGKNGARVWSVSRGGALHLAGVYGDVAIVIEPMAARAHDLTTGLVRWRAETGEISGRGTIAGSLLVQPRRAGGVAVVDLNNGSLREGLSNSDVVLGTLIPCADGWISQTAQTLQRVPFLEDSRREAIARWTANPLEATSVEVANLDLQSGDPAAARGRLEGLSSSRAKELRREAIVTLLRQASRRDAKSGSDAAMLDRKELGRELLNLCDSDDERLIAVRALGDAAWAAGDSVAALALFLQGIEILDTAGRRSVGDWPMDDASSRAVRKDRVLLGAIERILDEASNRARMSKDGTSAETLRQLEEALSSRLATARQSGDPFAVQTLVDNLLPLEWGRRTLLAESTAALYARPLKKAEPVLLTAAGSRDAAIAAQAAELLADLFASSGWKNEADALKRRLLTEHPGTPLAGGPTMAAKLAANSASTELRSQLLAPPADPWPNVIPNVETEAKRNLDVYQVPIAVNAAPGSLLDRLDVYVDRQGRSVRFAGEGHSGMWEVVLPGAPKPLRSGFANLDQVEAYGVGRLLVLRVGSEVFGIMPLDDRGEPHASVTSLQLDMAPLNSELPQESWWHRESVPGRLGIRPEGVRLVDGFGRTLGGLGPVRAGYLCYRSQAKLVAIDTQTGRRLWERLDLPPNCLAFGDNDRVYLWRTAEKSLQVLSAIDGRALDERAWDVSPDDVLMQHGSRTWVAVRKPAAGIELHDARDNSVVWASHFGPNAIPFAIDRDTVGVVDPVGLLHLLSADTGAPLGEALSINLPAKLEQIVCLKDAQRWYLAFSGPVPRLAVLKSEQVWGGMRMAFVNGWTYGIDRQTRSIVWRRWLESEPLPLEASRAAPVLVQFWRLPGADGATTATGDCQFKLIDKRTGREILSRRDATLQPYVVVSPGENHEVLDVKLERERIRLRYNSKSETPPVSGK